MRRLALLSLALLVPLACSTTDAVDPPQQDADPGVDSSIDSSTPPDEGVDTATDAPADTPSDTPTPVVETCPATFSTCTDVAGTTKFVRLKGTVVSPNKVFCDGEVLFSTETGKIVCVGDSCETALEAKDARVVCSKGVIAPGVIDPHEHADYNHMPVFKHTRKYDNRNTWRNHEPLYDSFKIPHRPFGSTNKANQILAQRWAEMRIAFAGGTAMAGTAGALLADGGIAGWLRNLDSSNVAGSGIAGGHYADPDTDTIVVSDSTGAISKTETETHVKGIVSRFGSASYRAFLPHLAEGIDINARLEFDEAVRLGAVTAKTSVIHCTGCSTPQLAQLAAVKGKLIWSPRSNLDLYGRTASVTTAKALGVKIALGVDWTPSGSMNPIGEMQCARKLNDTYYGRAFTDRDLVEMSTSNAAASLGFDDQLGSLDAGKWADIMVVQGDRTKPYKAILDARAEQFALVTVAGKAIYGDPAFLAGSLVNEMSCVKVPDGISPDGKPGVCGAPKTMCVDASHAGLADQLKMILSSAKSTDAACSGATPTGTHCYAYELFPLIRCDAGPELDRCVMGHPAIPRRAATGTTIPAVSGVPAPGTDDDGDGVPNAMDNCPTVFNPPFDLNTAQDDIDGDGMGDACDTDPCTKGGMNVCVGDSDGDGIKDDVDNCPTVSNADQKDTDGDMKGDACDACPMESNPGTMPCSVPLFTVMDVRNPASGKRPVIGASVKLEKLVITTVKSAGTNHAYVAQDATATAWAGIYVFIGTAAPTLVAGDEITVTGKFDIFRGLEQVNTTAGTVTKTGTATVPAPIVVLPSEIMTGGAKAKSLQSMLVRVNDVEAVTATSADVFKVAITATDTNQLTVTSFLANDTGASPFPAVVGDKYASITGVVYSFIATGMTDDSRLAPRAATDLVKK
jgi:large repetitive protein